MSDEKYTQKEREFLRLHELEHTLYSIERTIIERVGPRGLVNKSSNDRLRAWYALDVLKDVLQFQLPANKMNEARDFVINKELAEDNDDE